MFSRIWHSPPEETVSAFQFEEVCMRTLILMLGLLSAAAFTFPSGVAAQPRIVVADSEAEFSCTQGQHDWQYGYFEGSFASLDFQQMAQCGYLGGHRRGYSTDRKNSPTRGFADAVSARQRRLRKQLQVAFAVLAGTAFRDPGPRNERNKPRSVC